MRFFLALVLLLNSFAAFSAPASRTQRRAPAAAECDTPQELMNSNFSGRAFTNICRRIVAEDEGCKKLKPEKRMSCNAKRENQILSSADLLSKAGQCAKGFLWDSMVDLGKFILDLIKLLVKSQVNSVTGMIRFLSDSEYRQQTIAAAQSGSRMGIAFLNSAGLYFSREFTKNLRANPLNPLAAVGKTLLEPLMKFVTESVQAIAAHYIPQYQCMNGTAKLYTICRVLGDFIMPPAFMFTFLKFGINGLRALKNGREAAKIARVSRRFAEANELSPAARAAQNARRVEPPKPSRITVDQADGSAALRRRGRASALTPTPEQARHGVRPRPAEPLRKPIEEHSPDELIEIARSEKADSDAVADLNRAEAARIQAMNAQSDAAAAAPAAVTVDTAVEAQKLIDETPVTAAVVTKYTEDPVYAPLFQSEKQYADQHRDIAIVIKDMETRNPQMSKAEIQSEVNRFMNTCSIR